MAGVCVCVCGCVSASQSVKLLVGLHTFGVVHIFLTQRRRGLERLFKMRGWQGGRGRVSRQSQRVRGVVATFSVLRKH